VIFLRNDQCSVLKEVRLSTSHTFTAIPVLGTGLSLLVSSLSQQFGIGERCKTLWQYCWNFEKKADVPLRVPSTLDAARLEFIVKSDDGTIRRLVSPENAGTWKLNVSTLTLLPGRELPSRRARAVEFYHVLSGKGLFSQQGINETSQVEAGDCFVVDPGSMRWISNSNGTENLVLLRATDGGIAYSRPDFDVIRRDPNRRVTAMDVLKDSFRQAHVLALGKDYSSFNGTSSE